jgi:hypothetical protein
MIRLFMLFCFYFISLTCFSQGENQIKLRYWNGTTDGNGVTNPVGLQVSAVKVPIANALVRVDEATLSDETKFYLKKKFVLFFTVQNVSTQDVAIYDWAFKAVCPVDNMGRKFDATSMVPLVTPYIPASIYIVLKPGEKKQFYSAETDFFWCLPQDKDDLVNDPKYFQALITCGSIAGSVASTNPSQKLGSFQPTNPMPPKPENDIDPQLERMIKEHNDLILKNENDKAESLKSRILKITNTAYPLQIKLVESKMSKPQPATIVAPPAERGTLSFNGNNMVADGDCLEGTATLVSDDESAMLILNNLGNNGSFSVNANFYTNGCTDCLAIQFQDVTNSKIYIAVSGTVNRSAQGITINVTVKELMSVVEGGGSSYRVTGTIICE